MITVINNQAVEIIPEVIIPLPQQQLMEKRNLILSQRDNLALQLSEKQTELDQIDAICAQLGYEI